MKKIIKILGILFFCMSFCSTRPVFAGFEKLENNISKPGIVLCEVKSYGAENGVLQDQFLDSLYGKIGEQLQNSKNFHPIYSEARSALGIKDEALAQELSELHMMNIIESAHFETAKGDTCIELMKFARTYGDPVTEILSKQSFKLEGAWLERARKVAERHNAQYLAFFNVRHVKVDTKFKGLSTGDRVDAVIEYYLVNTKNGTVFHKRIFPDKRAYTTNVVVVVYGKTINVEGIWGGIVEACAAKIVKDIDTDGWKYLQD